MSSHERKDAYQQSPELTPRNRVYLEKDGATKPFDVFLHEVVLGEKQGMGVYMVPGVDTNDSRFQSRNANGSLRLNTSAVIEEAKAHMNQESLIGVIFNASNLGKGKLIEMHLYNQPLQIARHIHRASDTQDFQPIRAAFMEALNTTLIQDVYPSNCKTYQITFDIYNNGREYEVNERVARRVLNLSNSVKYSAITSSPFWSEKEVHGFWWNFDLVKINNKDSK